MTKRAMRVLETAVESLPANDAAQATAQLASLHLVIGEPHEALRLLKRTIPVLRRQIDALWYARALTSRGVAQTRLGRFAAADRDFAAAEILFVSQGDAFDAAGMRQNRGWNAAYAGDIPAALEHYDAAELAFAELGVPGGDLPLDRAELLLRAGLGIEARAMADQAVEQLAAAGMRGLRANALLLASQAALASGEPALALRRAAQARSEFGRQSLRGWKALAGYAAVRARWGAGDLSTRSLRLACTNAHELTAARLMGPALDARLIAGRTALALGRRPEARHELAYVAHARTQGTAEQRSRGWMAAALLRIDEGQRPSAFRALRAGLAVIDRHRATMGATELRAHASNHATDLATLGQRLAIESGRPAAVLEWTERWRGAALRLPPVRPPDDAELAADLAALRDVHTELQRAAAEGAPTVSMARRRAALEASVLRRTRRVSGTAVEADLIATPHDLTTALRDAALVELAAVDDHIVGVTLVDGRLQLHPLGDVPTVLSELDSIRFSLRRLAFAHGSAASVAGARAAATHSARLLDELLLAPLSRAIGDRRLVVVPPGGLHTLPWSLLPSCANRDVTIAPSATTWLRCAQSKPPRAKRVVLVAGPGLAGADDEVLGLGALHRGSIVLTGGAATAAATSAALDGAALAHVAAHGTFRGDNPLFSSLVLADGPLTVYDLERLTRAPYRFILSSCDSGIAGVRAGDELMGLAAAMFPLGTAGIVASVVPVPDGATRPLMVALHERLIEGATLSGALANARATLDPEDPAQYAAGAAFVAIGAH
ncbi:MAG: CHAT domain-containing protein [Mycobacteriales bacterium]